MQARERILFDAGPREDLIRSYLDGGSCCIGASNLSSKKILMKMERTTDLCRLLVMVYSIDCILILLSFMFYPLQHGKLAANMPYLSHDQHIYCVLLCFVRRAASGRRSCDILLVVELLH